MNESDARYSAAVVARRLGLPVRAALNGADCLLLAPSDAHENDAFGIEVRTSWRTIDLSFIPGKFARPLIEKMGEASSEARTAFSALASAALKRGKLTIRINGVDVDAPAISSWPVRWQKFELNLRRQGVVFEELSSSEFKLLLGDLITLMFGMCVALIGIDDVDADPAALEGDPAQVISRRYERRPVNREICLSLKGHRCYCCDLDFREVYGPVADGFIEVHHITPASEMGPAYRVNPATDLVPICSNCHSVVHLTKPPTSVDELRALFDAKRRSE